MTATHSGTSGTSRSANDVAVSLTIDGKEVDVPQGASVLDACTAAGVDTPTLCYAPNLTPANACRVCVVELEGSRTLIPSCSRSAEDGMVIETDSERVRHSRKMVIEFLGSGTDLSQADDLNAWGEQYGADPSRYGPTAEKIDEPVKVQDLSLIHI